MTRASASKINPSDSGKIIYNAEVFKFMVIYSLTHLDTSSLFLFFNLLLGLGFDTLTNRIQNTKLSLNYFTEKIS